MNELKNERKKKQKNVESRKSKHCELQLKQQ